MAAAGRKEAAGKGEAAKMKRRISVLISKIKDLFILHCPDCDGPMEQYINPCNGPNIYHCTKCGKDWV
jgi:hypothetical protein